ncbi:MAG: DUF4957 domain-containing protein [Bacteroidales bacterium]|nr:DUF4957 domain-containing protein [Candidatus Hennigimonas equi]
MKTINRIFLVSGLIWGLISLAGCSRETFREVEELSLTQCLQPTELSAKVISSKGNDVTFIWNVGKDVDEYVLKIYTDGELKEEALYQTVNILPSEMNKTLTLEADASYYYKVQATNKTKDPSKWAIYKDDEGNPKEIKTYAVKDPLYLKVDERLTHSITVSWSSEVADYKDVDHIDYESVDGTFLGSLTLSPEEIDAARAVITELPASTQLVVTLYFKSASRGQIDVWTMPDMEGLTEVSNVTALNQAVNDGARIKLMMEGSPYNLKDLNADARITLSKGIEIYGDEAADGTKPVIVGEFHIGDSWADGSALYFEGIEFNGDNGTYGFPLQKLNGGTLANADLASIIYKNCTLTGYSKGLIYEWGKTMSIGELTWESCEINSINGDGSGGGDVIDFRGASVIGKMNIVDNTIVQGMRTFIRVDAGTWGDIKVENNTMMNLCFVDNTNNAGLFGLQVIPSSLSFKNNLILNMEGKSTLGSENTKYKTPDDLALAASNNWFYNVVGTFFTSTWTQAKAAGTILADDPCYNAKGGMFNISPDSEIAGKKVGASKWWVPYTEEPEDLTLPLIEKAKTWNFGDAKYFTGTVKKQIVRDALMICGSDNTPINFSEGIVNFQEGATLTKKGAPTAGMIYFKVNKPGSVVIRPTSAVTPTVNHFVIGTLSSDGKTFTVKGGAAENTAMTTPQKIVINDIEEETLVCIYPSGAMALDKLAWSEDVSAINTALPSPEVTVSPESFTAGEAKDVIVSWKAVQNAGSYSVAFSGKTYPVEEGELSYTIPGKTTSMLDAGSYTVKVYANPSADDIYNTESVAGTGAFAVLPKGGGGEDEFIVASVEEFKTALEAGKDAITFKYSDTPYDLGAITLTAPLHLKGQTVGNKKTPLTVSFTISGPVGGSIVLRNLEFVGAASPSSLLVEDKVTASTTDTIAIYDSYIHGIKALYDNSGKATCDVQNLIFKGNIIENSSDGADFIDMRTGATHTLVFMNNTVANSCRTFLRTDAAHEMNYVTVRNNTFYKVATNSSSKDNNGIFHVRSAAGAGLQDYKVQNNLFYSILIETDPGHANGFPKFKSTSGLAPNTIMNNYFFNCEDRAEKAAYSFWAYIPKEQTLTGGGAILPADPCKDAANGDFTLINGVAMNNNIGDPRWNPMRGGRESSEITVNNTDEFLTAISAGKTTITLASGEYDLNAVSDVESVASGKVTLTSTLNLIGQSGAVFKGGFVFKGGITKFTAKGITFDGASTVENVFEIGDETVQMSSVIVRGSRIANYKNRLFYMNCLGSLQSLEFQNDIVSGISGADFTSGDFIDIRKGAVTALKVQNCTFANCIRTFARIDAGTVISSIAIVNNTFYNLCYVDSKDNNGIFHVRATSLTENNFNVRNNIFAGMHRAAVTPGNAAGYPKIVSTNTASKIPSFGHNYFYDIDHAEGYDFWTKDRITEDVALTGYGIILSEDPFKNAASADFTLVNALAASEKIGDQRWNTARPQRPDGFFEVADLAGLLTAIDAGKKDILLTGTTYDFTADETLSGTLKLVSGINLKGTLTCGQKPQIIGAFSLENTDGAFEISNVRLDGNSSINDMIVIAAGANVSKLSVVNCDVSNYKNRLISGPNESVCGPVIIKGCKASGVEGANFTGGDFIDFRKGSVSSIKVSNSTFANAIRTFVRVDAAVVCNAVSVENNTFYNVLTAVSKDNNGIMHVRSTTATAKPRQITVRKNIFACSHPDEAALAEAADNVKKAGFPKLVSTTSETIAHPTISDNFFYDLKFEGDAYTWWNTMKPEDIPAAGTVLTETPFAGDPSTGNFTVKTPYKGYGDVRW